MDVSWTTTRRRMITLMELLIVIAIMSLAAGLIGINIAKAVREQRFKTEVSLITDQLRLAQDIMLVLDIGVHLKFAKDPEGNGIIYHLEADAPLPKGWSREVERSHKQLQAIHFVSIKDELEYPASQGVLDIKFLSRGSVMTRGLLRLSTSETSEDQGALEAFICLPGYPRPIVSLTKCDRGDCLKDLSNEERVLTQMTKEEVFPYFLKKEASGDVTPP